jgi:hypothetical protein
MSTKPDEAAGPKGVRYPYHSLEDFLVAKMLTVDGEAEDGWNAGYPIKGREIEASVLFADITGFSARTADLDPTETLAFVNHFFTWISAEALRGRPGIVDKYIGDEIMVVFSKEFGSVDPLIDAVRTARWMGESDVFAFLPHVGIASGRVIVGYVGTPLKYSCSIYGAPVAVAARCAAVKPVCEGFVSSYMTFPADEWKERQFDKVFPPKRYRESDDSIVESPHSWELTDSTSVEFKNLGETEIRQVVRRAGWAPSQPAEDRAREIGGLLAKAGRRWHPPSE